MSYDFFADLALREETGLIDQVVNHQGQYAILQEAQWTTKAQVLATGLEYDDKKFPETDLGKMQKSLNAFIKNGRLDKRNNGQIIIEKIGAYPELLEKTPLFQPTAPLDIAEFCTPKPDCLGGLPDGSCLLRIGVKLHRPFASKDDLAFYPHENPLRREWVFQTPCLAASGVKGLLRWAFRMCFGDSKKNGEETVLFGPRNEGLKDGDGQAGCLYLWPLFWKGKVGLEVLNPHDRQSGAGKDPIKYEIVQSGATADIWLLLLNRHIGDAALFWAETVPPLIQALGYLLTESGLSAKRSADWGTVDVTDVETWIQGVTAPSVPVTTAQPAAAPADPWFEVMDKEGELFPFDRLDIWTAKRLVQLTGKSEKRVKGKYREDALSSVQKKFTEYQAHKAAQQVQAEEGAQTPPEPSVVLTTKSWSGGKSLDQLKQWWKEQFSHREECL